jgi:hypothetical protein
MVWGVWCEKAALRKGGRCRPTLKMAIAELERLERFRLQVARGSPRAADPRWSSG